MGAVAESRRCAVNRAGCGPRSFGARAGGRHPICGGWGWSVPRFFHTSRRGRDWIRELGEILFWFIGFRVKNGEIQWSMTYNNVQVIGWKEVVLGIFGVIGFLDFLGGAGSAGTKVGS